MRLKGRTDANHQLIAKTLKQMGCSVISLANVGHGVPDLLCGCGHQTLLIEIKDGDKSPSRQKLTEDEQRFHAEWRGGPCVVIRSVDEAIQLVETTRKQT